jgi:predicted LPLAT superfamily acyltransferase
MSRGEPTPRGADPQWKAQRERSTPLMLALLIGLARTLGRAPVRLLLYPIVAYFLLTGGSQRQASRGYLQRVLGRVPGLRDQARHFFTFASCALDRVFLLGGGRDQLDVEEHRHGPILEIAREGGCILLVSHIGSFEALRVNGTQDHSLSVRVLMDRAHNPMVTQMLEALNPVLAANVIDASTRGPDLVLQLKQALSEGHVIGIMGDRLREDEPATEVDFLGGRIRLPSSPWILAGVLGVPVLLGFGLYRGGRRYDCHYEVFERQVLLSRRERGAAVQACAQRYADRLAHYAKSAPYNWFNFYDFWLP